MPAGTSTDVMEGYCNKNVTITDSSRGTKATGYVLDEDEVGVSL